MDLEGTLDVLLALQNGNGDVHDLAQRTGMPIHAAHQLLGLLKEAGFVDPTQNPDVLKVSRSGRVLLDSGYEECYKRALWERLGGDLESAS